ncbi:MAG: PrsW family intramembrane metalloprotease, partial [Sciscionella sp.]
IDGIVYAGVTAAGFAFTENIFYFGMAFDAGGLGDASGGVVAAFMLRWVLSPFVHPLFTAMTGIGIGVAASSRVRSVRIVAPLLGYLTAVGLHALWNGSAVIGGSAAFLNLYFLVMVPIFAGVLWLIVWQRRREQDVVTRQLPSMAREGLIAQSEIGLFASQPGRRRWRAEVRREAGRRAVRAVSRYQSAVTELAFLRHATGRRTARTDAAHRQRVLIDELTAARHAAVRHSTEREVPVQGVDPR